MNWQFKKLISIFLALLIGTTIVFFSWKNINKKEETQLASTDNEDWRATLSVAPQDEFIKTLNPTGKNIDPLETEATTTTTVLGQRLLTEFIASQANSVDGTISDAEVIRISNLLQEQVITQGGKQYALRDINISQDNSRDANIAYINVVNALVKKHMDTEKNENELSILISALNTGDANTLNKLDAKAVLYQELINKLVALKTPSGLASTHLHALQGFEALRSSTLRFKKTLIDPAEGLAALSEYSSGLAIVASLQKEYNDYFSKL